MKLAWKTPADNRADALEDMRDRRDALISDTDWTQLLDADLTADQKAAWKTYRQALRDVTKPYKADPALDPTKAAWPVPPS